MYLSERTKNEIESEFKTWVNEQYAGRSEKEREAFGQYFTPPAIIYSLIEKYEVENFNGFESILDPTSGAGGLLAAVMIAGADPDKVYGVELDPDIFEICYKRLDDVAMKFHGKHFNKKHLCLGNALDKRAYAFDDDAAVDIQVDYINRVFSENNLSRLAESVSAAEMENLSQTMQKVRTAASRLQEMGDYEKLIALRTKAHEIISAHLTKDTAKFFPKHDIDFTNVACEPKKFDCIIGNPPYNRQLHLEILVLLLNEILREGGMSVTIQPLQQFGTFRLLSNVSGVKKDVIDCEKHIKAIYEVDAKTCREEFSINIDSNLGIFVAVKNDGVVGIFEKYVDEKFAGLRPVWEKVVSKVMSGEYPSLKDKFKHELVGEDRDRPFVRFGGAIAGRGEVNSAGTMQGDYAEIVSLKTYNDLEKKIRPVGGYVTYKDLGDDPERGVAVVLERMAGDKERNWLMRACNLCVKNGRDLIPQCIPWFDVNDTRTDEEIAMQDFGMTAEEVDRAKVGAFKYIVNKK